MTRKSPVEYLNLYRIERASRKLLNSDMSVTDVAFACGFNDLSYFIKTFKAVKGFLGLPFFKKNSEELINKARVRFGSADYSSAPEVMRKTMVNLINQDMTPYIPEIIASTLLVWGENDTATPLYMAKKIEKMIKDCGLCVIKDAGHWAFVEKPAQVHAILRRFIP